MRSFRSFCGALGAFAVSLTVSLGDKPAEPSPRSPLTPEEALRAFRLPDDLRIELFAAEPHVQSPVAMAFDENGRVYVVEMGDYPLGKKGGRVKLLEDTDGDGRIDRATVFADHLAFPNGVMPLKGGVLVSSAPDLLFLQDTNGDGKADVRKVVFTGFAESNPQHRFNSPTYSIDNWIYCADGESPNGIRPGDQPEAKPIELRGSDFRFRPDFSHFELVSGRGQYGMAFDDWDNRFINHNSLHIRHPILPRQYLDRNPNLAVPEVIDEIATEGYAARVFPASKVETRFNDPEAAGHFTSACSPLIYRADALPQKYRGCAFVCEPVHNLVHQCVLEPRGVSFVAKRAKEGVEFLASTDNWCRPVSLTVGPDGALYVVDMYRAVIEHPQWIPLDIQKKIDLRAGADRGRIYRIVPKAGLKAVKPQLGRASVAEVVAQLENANAWWRQTAQRLLVERQDKAAVTPLRKLAKESPKPLARLHALWTLEGLAALEETQVLQALREVEPGLREHGLRLAEPRLAASPQLQAEVVKLAVDNQPRVRFQAAFTLGEMPAPHSAGGSDHDRVPALAKIARRDVGDRWVRTAVLSSVPQRLVELLRSVSGQSRGFFASPSPGAVAFVRESSATVGARRGREEINDLLAFAFSAANSDKPSRCGLAALSGLGESLRRSGARIEKFLDKPVADRLRGWTEESLKTACDANRDVAERVDALALLALLPDESAGAPLQQLLEPQAPMSVQLAAVRALAAIPGEKALAAALADWSSRTPPVRRELLGALLSRPERTRLLLQAVETGQVRAAELDADRRNQLLRYPDDAIRDRARQLFETEKPSSRHQVVQDWGSRVLALGGDAVRGQKVYETHCANCHRLHGRGVAVGPDLATVSGRAKESLLVDILDPNRAVDPLYVDYQVITANGQIQNGIVAAETSNSVTLRRAERQESTILRKDIAEIRATSVSLMPEGLEKNVSPQDLADLLELLRRGKVH